ncbi:hypothetical protein GYB59_08915 [bacterium]|nr:hypothetical protein [bacterium]
MSEQHRKRVKHFEHSGHAHELTFSCYHRFRLLTNPQWLAMLSVSVQRAVEGHRYRLIAFVFMPEHVHLLVLPSAGASPVSSLLRAIKRPFSFRVKQRLIEVQSPLLDQLTVSQRPGVTTFRFWQEGPGYDRNLTTPAAMQSAIDYIHRNPVRRQLCERAVDWPWSSARQFLASSSVAESEVPKIDPLPPECQYGETRS